jgi:hypothetical protein
VIFSPPLSESLGARKKNPNQHYWVSDTPLGHIRLMIFEKQIQL